VRSTFEYNLQARRAMNAYFSGWLEHHQQQKQKWGSLVKYRYLLGRMKLNKVFWAWKIKVRERKVQRLKASIIEHQTYKRTLRLTFKAWTTHLGKVKNGIEKLRFAWRSYSKRLTIALFKYGQDDLKAKTVQHERKDLFVAKQHMIKAIKGFRSNVALQKRMRHNKALAKDFNERLYKRKTLKMIYTFS